MLSGSKLIFIILVFVSNLTFVSNSISKEFRENDEVVSVQTKHYQLSIELTDFQVEVKSISGSIIAPKHPESFISLNGQAPVNTRFEEFDETNNSIHFFLAFDSEEEAEVILVVKDNSIKVSVIPTDQTKANDIETRFGMISGNFYGLADDGVDVKLSGLDNIVIENDGAHDRFVSTFSIAPNIGFAQVLIAQLEEKFIEDSSSNTPHKVSINKVETMLGIKNVKEVKDIYYFFGDVKDIYSEFKLAKKNAGLEDVKPLYSLFGIGWELWPFAKWNQTASDVYDDKKILENIKEFTTQHSYNLSWVVIGSGFWKEGGSTLSFGEFNTQLYPDNVRDGLNKPNLISKLNGMGIDVLFGLRTSFPDCLGNNDFSSGGENGTSGNCFSPLSRPRAYEEGIEKGYFATLSNGDNFTTQSDIFPQWDPSLVVLDSTNNEAVEWYVDQTSKWNVNGWKEDSMLTGSSSVNKKISSKIYHDRAWNPPMKSLHERGDLVIARNAYVSTPGSLQRLNDTFGEEIRIPQLVLSYAASGSPNVYTDIVGNHDQENGQYIERHAKLAALTPSISFGIKPWEKNTPNRNTGKNVKAAVDWHERYKPYIYSAALKTANTGFPYTITPLPLAFPKDNAVHDLAETKMWQWMVDSSILATPLFDSKNTSFHDFRDVYLPEGNWIDFNTGQKHTGPKLLKGLSQSGTNMPVFIGGDGILVFEKVVGNDLVQYAEIWPVGGERDSDISYSYHHYEYDKTSKIQLAAEIEVLKDCMVIDTTQGTTISSSDIIIDEAKGTLSFPIIPGNNYKIVSLKIFE